jgi:hypothetical protein
MEWVVRRPSILLFVVAVVDADVSSVLDDVADRGDPGEAPDGVPAVDTGVHGAEVRAGREEIGVVEMLAGEDEQPMARQRLFQVGPDRLVAGLAQVAVDFGTEPARQRAQG